MPSDPFGPSLEAFGHERIAVQVARAMAKRDAEGVNLMLEDASRYWGFYVAAEIDARAQELVALGQVLSKNTTPADAPVGEPMRAATGAHKESTR